MYITRYNVILEPKNLYFMIVNKVITLLPRQRDSLGDDHFSFMQRIKHEGWRALFYIMFQSEDFFLINAF